MAYVAGISYKWIAGAVAVGVPGFAVALIYLSPVDSSVSSEIPGTAYHGKDFPQQQ